MTVKSSWHVTHPLPNHEPINTLGMIWAQDTQGLIGLDNQMPWHVPDDFKHFKETTLGCAIITGRSNFEAMGGVLPKRQNIVLTRSQQFAHAHKDEDVTVAGSLKEAFDEVADPELAWVIGGGTIYAQAMEYADILVVSQLDITVDVPEGSQAVYAPKIDPTIWVKDEARSDAEFRPQSGDAAFRVDVYIRR